MKNRSFLDIVKEDMLTESGHYYGCCDNAVLNEGLEEGENVRVLQTPNEFIDIMTEMEGNNKFVSYGYISGAGLNIPKTKKINPETGRMKGFDDYTQMGKELGYENGIGGIIKFTRMLVNFQTPDQMASSYQKYKQDTSDIRNEFGVPEIKKKEDYTNKVNYGTNKLDVYSGDNPELQGHMYSSQNVYSAYNQTEGSIKRKVSTYYIIGTDGEIIETCSPDRVKEIFSKFGNEDPYSPEVSKLHKRVGGGDSGLSALRRINADDETMMNYLKKVDGLKFIYRRFEFSSIVFMVGTCNGQKFYYSNSNLTRMPKGVGVEINPKVFIDMANQKYKKSIDEIGQCALEDMSNRNVNESCCEIDNTVDKDKLYDIIVSVIGNDKELHDKFTLLANALVKHIKRGEEVTMEKLANSSVMGGIIRTVLQKYSKLMYNKPITVTPFERKELRMWAASQVFHIMDNNDYLDKDYISKFEQSPYYSVSDL